MLLAAGGNGIALGLLGAWAVLKAAELRGDPDEDVEVIGAAVCAAVLIMLPLVEDFANVFAGLGGRPGRRRLRLGRPLSRRERSAEDPARVTVDKFTALTPRAPPLRGRAQLLPRRGRPRGVEAAAEEMGDLALMQIAGDQAAFMTILVQAIGARRAWRSGPSSATARSRSRAACPRTASCLLRAGAGVRRPRPGPPGAGGAARPGRDPGRPGDRDAGASCRTTRAVRLRLHRRRQGGLPELLRAVPAPAAPGRPDPARQHASRAAASSIPTPTTRPRRGAPSSTTASPPTSGSRWRCWASPTASRSRASAEPAMAVPSDRRAVGAAGPRRHATFWRLLAEGSGGAVWERDGVLASIIPAGARPLDLQLGLL